MFKLLILSILLTGCNCAVYPKMVKALEVECKDAGGWVEIYNSGLNGFYARCADGTYIQGSKFGG